MDQEIKSRWLSKLREPGRKQGKHILRSSDGAQCCLDLLCEIAVEDGIIPEPELLQDRYIYKVPPNDFNSYSEAASGVLPVAVSNWAGLQGENPRVFTGPKFIYEKNTVTGEFYGMGLRLSQLNDELNQDFLRIADYIEGDKTL